GPTNDPPMQALAAAGNTTAWMNKFWEAVTPYVNAGMAIGFDMSSGIHEGDLAYQAIQQLKARGVTVYGEPRYALGISWWFSQPVVASDDRWHITDPDYTPIDLWWEAHDSNFTADVVRLIDNPPAGKTWDDPTWVVAEAKSILSDGHSAGLGVHYL